MKKQLEVWKKIAESLRNKIPVMLLYVLESKGSSPGRQGFLMCVNAANEMEGSIGGGVMEHKFIEMAKEKLKGEGYNWQVRRQVHDKSAARDRSGMICSGEQTILIYEVKDTESATVDHIIDSLLKNKNGTVTLDPAGVQFSDTVPPTDFHFEMTSEEDWIYREKTGYKNHLYIIGGGHCSLALSRIMGMMDFFIHVFDERGGLNTMEQNSFAHEKTVVKSYSDLSSFIPPGDNHYVVIMTFGFRTDEIALRALLGRRFKYLGLLGSRKKIEEMFNALRADGVSQEILDQINAPVGISIKSQTTEEIAVSIAAEIIGVKNAEL